MATKEKAKAPSQDRRQEQNGNRRRPSGVTRKQVLSMVDWSALSFQQFAKSQHVALKVDKSTRPFIYRVA
jgi:hypothetical protein